MKLHGYLLFFPVTCYWLLHVWRGLVQKNSKIRLARIFKKFGLFIIISLVVYFIGWPWLWFSPLQHVQEYLRLQIVHEGVPVYVFGQTYERVDWWYTPLMFVATTPIFVLAMFLLGSLYTIKKGSSWDKYIFLNAIYPISFFSLPWVYRYDWVRLFLASYPFICLIVGKGIYILLRSTNSRIRILVIVGFVVAWFFSIGQIMRIHPWESSYYNEVVGGIAGASKLGFETEFWGNSYLGVLPWMNSHKSDFMCVTPTTHPFYYYQAMGQIESGVIFNAERNICHYLVVLMRQGLFSRDPLVSKVVATQKPVYTVSIDGVSLVSVYNILGMK